MTVEEENSSENSPKTSNDVLRRSIFAGLGVLFVIIAAVGVFLPLIPTVGPLLLASLFLTKSNPAWERKLIHNRFFARYLHLLDGKSELTQRERIVSIALMWTSILVSCIVLSATGSAAKPWLIVLLLLLGVIGTVFILRFGKKKSLDSGSDS